MPVFRILYTSKTQDHAVIHSIDWVCPAAYRTIEAVRRKFEERHPTASILQLREWEL